MATGMAFLQGLPWAELPALPAPISGQFAGVSSGALLVLGGASFDKPPYDCGTMPVLRRTVSSRLSATGYGVLNMSGCLAGGIGAAAVGFLKENMGLGPAFAAAGACLPGEAIALTRVPAPERNSD